MTDAAGVAEVPEGHQLEVQLELTELHQVSEPAPGVTKKTLVEPEGSYQKPNDGSKVTVVVTTRSADGATVYEAEREVEYTTDEEMVSSYCLLVSASTSRHLLVGLCVILTFNTTSACIWRCAVCLDAQYTQSSLQDPKWWFCS